MNIIPKREGTHYKCDACENIYEYSEEWTDQDAINGSGLS